MASTTSNLGLHLLGTSLQDKETYFETWRQEVNGEHSSSNMQIIDAAYGDMAEDIQNIKDGVITNEAIDEMVEHMFDD